MHCRAIIPQHDLAQRPLMLVKEALLSHTQNHHVSIEESSFSIEASSYSVEESIYSSTIKLTCAQCSFKTPRISSLSSSQRPSILDVNIGLTKMHRSPLTNIHNKWPLFQSKNHRSLGVILHYNPSAVASIECHYCSNIVILTYSIQ